MGLYDTIMVYMQCPYCNHYQHFDAQTKDLGQNMHTYNPYDEDQLLDRTTLPVFKSYPEDRCHNLWKNQDELMRERATVEDIENGHVSVISSCHSVECQFYADRTSLMHQSSPSGFGRHFDGKIKIKDGMLVGKIYDIELDEQYTEEELDKYKEKYSEIYQELKEKFKHDPIILHNWHHNFKKRMKK